MRTFASGLSQDKKNQWRLFTSPTFGMWLTDEYKNIQSSVFFVSDGLIQSLSFIEKADIMDNIQTISKNCNILKQTTKNNIL